MIRNSLYILIIFLVISCTKNEVHQIVENKIIFPQIHSVEISDVLHADRIGLSDSALVVINRKSAPFFYVYNRKDYSKIGAFGISGSGPEDYTFPFFLQQCNPRSGDLTVYDVGFASFRNIHFSRLFSKQGKAVFSSPMSPLLMGASVLIKNDSVYYGTIDNGEGLFFIYDSLKNERKWIHPYSDKIYSLSAASKAR